ncbi:helix-turn-helix domain-containing protein [Alcanivorax sp. 1008]|uniref:helix-turn-helix domain-containing protein n=1 Tax=Alcanivorax sp. 1008 TaxID=2816853 RepID=UPI001DC21A5B|nr:helix-turn-helix transcriptional regulator [Alcanivorax sp. 1008]MCC1498313.1 helix-turn-helix transcriptional regulator [Alcanivorax sp. 1008]
MINRALKTIRQFHGLTQAELASKLSMSKSYLSEIESGKKSVGYDLLERYSEIFDVPVSSLVFFSENIEEAGSIPEKFRNVFAGKILKIMEWVALRDEAKTA